MKNFVFLPLLFLAGSLFAQNAPQPIEVMLSPVRANFLMLVSRPIDAAGKFSFFNVTVGEADYKNTPAETEIVVSNSITYDFGKGFSVAPGLQWHNKVGFVPNLGLQYVKASPDYLFVLYPALDLLPTYSIETVALAEYKPKIKSHVRLYTRLQGLFVQDIEQGLHARSGINIRAGLTFDQFTVGLGSNFDAYGPEKFDKVNHGLFVQLRL
jgi:hypothetical protein